MRTAVVFRPLGAGRRLLTGFLQRKWTDRVFSRATMPQTTAAVRSVCGFYGVMAWGVGVRRLRGSLDRRTSICRLASSIIIAEIGGVIPEVGFIPLAAPSTVGGS